MARNQGITHSMTTGMSKQEVLKRVQTSFQKTFGTENSFNPNLKKADLAKWDSLHHVVFMLALEQEFGVKFGGATVAQMISIEKIVDHLAGLA